MNFESNLKWRPFEVDSVRDIAPCWWPARKDCNIGKNSRHWLRGLPYVHLKNQNHDWNQQYKRAIPMNTWSDDNGESTCDVHDFCVIEDRSSWARNTPSAHESCRPFTHRNQNQRAVDIQHGTRAPRRAQTTLIHSLLLTSIHYQFVNLIIQIKHPITAVVPVPRYSSKCTAVHWK